ncbi:MAG: DUF6786 family protein [Mariniphaga sp.]
MRRVFSDRVNYLIYLLLAFNLFACNQPVRQKAKVVEKAMTVSEKGTYGFDVAFLAAHKIETLELRDSVTKASLLVIPAWQGRVMTSSANGLEGKSFGWINYKLIESGKVSPQFNAYGGEERFWLGPEGGPFSIYFPKGKEQVFANWIVPKELDSTPFELISKSSGSATFKNDFTLANASGTNLVIGIERSIKLLSRSDVEQSLKLTLGDSLNFVAYETENTLTNKGTSAWTEKTGFLSIWLLSMFNPSEQGVVFIPFKSGKESDLGKIVTDDYFGKVPPDRLKISEKMLFFKTDGKHRSKIGLSPNRALSFCGSYDPINKVLTLLTYSKPEGKHKYVNSKWGEQKNPLSGDAVNSYNDGPVADGSIMGPFYEIESSSPAALLAPGGKIMHKQQIFHISGNENKLSDITQKLFGTSISSISQAFK